MERPSHRDPIRHNLKSIQEQEFHFRAFGNKRKNNCFNNGAKVKVNLCYVLIFGKGCDLGFGLF